MFSSHLGEEGQGFSLLGEAETNLVARPATAPEGYWDIRQVSWQFWGTSIKNLRELVRWGFLSWTFPEGDPVLIGPLDGYQFPEGIEEHQGFNFLRSDPKTHRSVFCYNTGVMRLPDSVSWRIRFSYANPILCGKDLFLRITLHGDHHIGSPF